MDDQKGKIMKYRVKIEQDQNFDPRNPLCHEELIADFENGETFAYVVTVEKKCPECGHWHDEQSTAGVLLDREYWAGSYTPVDIENDWKWMPSPDTHHLVGLINEMTS